MKKNYRHIVVLTGAGFSAESGIKTFRGSNGLWNNQKVEDVATIEAFQRQPDFVHNFYNQMKPELRAALPNPAHLALAQLEKNYHGKVSIVTQNVDTLHEKAGSQNVYHIHGQINQAVCLNCGKVLETWESVDTSTVCPQCAAVAVMKPNIVFFGEMLLYMDQVEKLLQSCDLFMSAGTSGVVFPAAGFVQTAKYYGAETIEFNLEQTSNNYLFDHHIYGKVGTTLPLFVTQLINKEKLKGDENA